MLSLQNISPKLDTYLNGTGPIGVAVSGGGDSVALLHALAACITAGVITGAAAREIKLNRVSSSVSADIDVRGVLGIDPDIRKGFSHVQVEFDIDAECDDEAIDALVAAGTKYSAVFDMLVNPTEVDVIRHR